MGMTVQGHAVPELPSLQRSSGHNRRCAVFLRMKNNIVGSRNNSILKILNRPIISLTDWNDMGLLYIIWRYIMKKISLFTLSIILSAAALHAADDQSISKAGSHVCQLSSEKNRTRLAVYTFTDDKDQETPFSKKCTTQIISIVLRCGNIKVIDPSKIKKVLDEQEKGMTGIVDDKTAPETGKMLGADSLLFGQVDAKGIQIRIIDAATGEILGARVEESGGKAPTIVRQEFKDESSRAGFRAEQHRKQLRFLFDNRPGVFLFLTSTDAELEKFKAGNPKHFERIQKMIDNAPADKREMHERSRKLFLEMRGKNRRFNEKIISDQKTIIMNFNDKRGKQR